MTRMLQTTAFSLAALLSCASFLIAQDDTKAVLALGEIGAQMQLDGGRIIALILSGERADDEAMKLVAGLERLQTLRIADGKITAAGLAHAAKLPALHTLVLVNTPLADRDVEQLAQLESVSTYVLHGTEISGMGLQRLEALLAKAKREATVEYHRGGLFGVTGNPTLQRCVINTVVAESAAASAELQPGDIIVKFDGREIENFQTLQEVVSHTPPGEPIEVQIERDGKTIAKKVTLTRRPATL